MYQRFHGEGTMSLAQAATGWAGGTDVLLFSVPVIGGATDVAVQNDAWTAANGGDYRILLNNSDQTGPIDLSTSVQPEGSASRFDVRAFATGHDLRVQAVVDMERPQSGALRRAVATEQVQQYRRIQAAAVADHTGRASLRTRGQPQLRDSRLARSIHSRWSRW